MVHSFHPLRGISRVSGVGSGKPDKALKLVLSTSTSLRNEISNQQVDYLNYSSVNLYNFIAKGAKLILFISVKKCYATLDSI